MSDNTKRGTVLSRSLVTLVCCCTGCADFMAQQVLCSLDFEQVISTSCVLQQAFSFRDEGMPHNINAVVPFAASQNAAAVNLIEGLRDKLDQSVGGHLMTQLTQF